MAGMSREAIHYEHMLFYASHPHLFNLADYTVQGNIIEPRWFRRNGQRLTKEHESLCDIVFLLENEFAVPVEIKRSRKSRQKALSQLSYGKQYIEEVLKRETLYGAIGYYESGQHITEQISW